ncbi:hypothetical protein DPMN_188041 [Dreissena polymorpha]|uniref:Uncharacterized protein n=1 Tax=Dreissena polymorpha TaxID=45954 RepID=A0A9D4DRQ0_DREPO|nr:hypothetical protein DPMN_188041 [Dreissena polymorpha]
MARQRPTCIPTPHDPGVLQVEIERIVIREKWEEIIVKGNFGWAWPMWAGHPRIIRIAIREVQYQFEDIRCSLRCTQNFQGSSAYSVGGESGQDRQTDGQK